MPNKLAQNGDQAEREVVNLVPCPNCQNNLVRLPTNNALFDVQCSRCSFRAQVKGVGQKPSSRIRGAGWEVMDKVSKSGYLIPSLFINFKWKDKTGIHQEIRFYPFIAKRNLQKRLANIKSHNREHWMFDYVNLDEIPFMKVYSN